MAINDKVAVVTGSSSGIGFETSLALARNGYHTYATIRDIRKSKKIEAISVRENILIKTMEMDVNCDTSVKETMDKIISETGRIDVLVNNAGYGLFGALEDFDMDSIRNQFETNVFGVIRVAKSALPIMRDRREGLIVNVTSLAGLIGVPAESVYASTKFAVEGLSESLSYELEPFGVRIIIVEPGVINTSFVEDLVVPDLYGINKKGQFVQNKENEPSSISNYHDTIGKFLKYYYSAMSNAPHPQLVASEILQAIKKTSNKANSSPIIRVTIGSDSQKYSKLKRELGDDAFHTMLRRDLLG
ncbi:SDR family oxidoreductase [Candidatus Nitrosocosmicus franklandus]|uniref:3-hydroxybutyrate dehydrogenase n=1 Tax=Candidatus Nitrosocosmicus franklandianus TaxID=1798806 RepID=A0A484IEW2_9ARCH|nr:SDR family oxidoreductase [Candidatus Nitrosocosmicus franklandus]VFJ15367.1 Putative 3-hydroxybutyrate dehydrogenase [Candidatus Nitrosocosmicus franklandus]